MWWDLYWWVYFKFTAEYDSERILKIGQYWAKIWTIVWCLVFRPLCTTSPTIYYTTTTNAFVKTSGSLLRKDRSIWLANVKVELEGSTGRVAFDQFGQRRNYQLDVLEQRGDHETAKVRSFSSADRLLFHLYYYHVVANNRFFRVFFLFFSASKKTRLVFTARSRYCQGKLSVRPSVRLSVCDVEVSWSYRLEFCENNFPAD